MIVEEKKLIRAEASERERERERERENEVVGHEGVASSWSHDNRLIKLMNVVVS